MQSKNKYKLLKILAFLGACVLSIGTLWSFASAESEDSVIVNKVKTQLNQRTVVAKEIASHIKANNFPESITIQWDGNDEKVSLAYTIDPVLQKEAEKLLKSYKPDYGAIFMYDAITGEVLTMVSFQKDDPHAANLNLQATFPAASVFKVVTATAAVDKAGVAPETKIRYNGGAYTLYKKNVLSDRVTRWTNVITLRDAFARSINTAFGRLSIENLRPEDLNEYANRFMFNQEIPTDFPVDIGVAYIPPEKGFEMAEAASGYNRNNRMSPVQGAMIAAAVANDGEVVVPYLIQKITSAAGKELYTGEPLNNGPIMTKESSAKVRQLMEQTVMAGTSRRSFRPILRDRKYREVEMGGKTGHLTGDNPKGRVDWFVGYAMNGERKVAVAAITVNKKYWTVKSAHLGQSMFRKYFGPIAGKNPNSQRMISSQR